MTTPINAIAFLNRAELTPKQKQLDVNNDGKISSDDLKKLREGKKPEDDVEAKVKAHNLAVASGYATAMKKIASGDKDVMKASPKGYRFNLAHTLVPDNRAAFRAQAKAAIKVNAAVNIDKDMEGANPKIIAAAKKLAQHCKISHAQFDSDSGGSMLVLKPSSDSLVAYGEKIFSTPEMGSISDFMITCSSVGEAELHTEASDRSDMLYIEIFTD